VEEAEGARVPEGLPPVIDAHVHLFPDRVFAAIWRWFGAHAWPIRYQLTTPRLLEFLFARGVTRVVGLAYPHTAGMARSLNAYMTEVCRAEPRVTGLATVLPGEPGARDILREAFAAGLAGVKLHCHVQCFAPDASEAMELFELCQAAGKPVVIHAGREPISAAYRCDPRQLCSAERLERVLRAFPRLALCVPHLGVDELDAYRRLHDRHQNLWLDTTMMLAGYFPGVEASLEGLRSDRLLYGSDFPNLPYAWDRELRRIASLGLPEEAIAGLLAGNARALYGC